MLHKLAKVGDSRTNICRNLHRLIDRSDVLFPVLMSTTPVTIKLRKPRPHTTVVDWPIIKMTDWAQTLLQRTPQYMLGGMKLEQVDEWSRMFSMFWSFYRTIDPSHPIYNLPVPEHGKFLPYAIHGDEGRGLRNKAFLVESFQPLIGVWGPMKTNESGQPDSN